MSYKFKVPSSKFKTAEAFVTPHVAHAVSSMMSDGTHLAELVVALIQPRLDVERLETSRARRSAMSSSAAAAAGIGVGAADRLLDDLVDDAEPEQIRRGDLQRRRGFDLLAGSRHRIAAQPSGGMTL